MAFKEKRNYAKCSLKKRLYVTPNYSPVSWLRGESFFAFCMFAATGYMGQQVPPHNVFATLKMTTPSPLFTFLFQGQLTGNASLFLTVSPIGIVLFVVSLLFGGMVIISYIKRMPVLFSISMGIVTVASGYLAVMLSIR